MLLGYNTGALLSLAAQVRKTPRRPRSWANSSLLSLYSHRNARASVHLLGQPNTFLAAGLGRRVLRPAVRPRGVLHLSGQPRARPRVRRVRGTAARPPRASLSKRIGASVSEATVRPDPPRSTSASACSSSACCSSPGRRRRCAQCWLSLVLHAVATPVHRTIPAAAAACCPDMHDKRETQNAGPPHCAQSVMQTQSAARQLPCADEPDGCPARRPRAQT
jgi:hypothetical protein